MKMTKLSKICFCLLVLSFTFQLTGCSTAWTSEASGIIAVLVPAIQAALAILSGLGLRISPNVMTSFSTWASQAQSDLTNIVAPLINKYNSTVASAQPGILEEIQAALDTIVSGLNKILPAIKITDTTLQSQITLVLEAISGEMTALINLVPALKGEVTSHDQLKALMHQLKTANEFKKDFNEKVSAIDPKYQIA